MSTRTSPAPEHASITQCLTSIQRKLLVTRLAERAAVALVWSAAIALPLTGARLLANPTPWIWAGYGLAASPLLAGACLWFFTAVRPEKTLGGYTPTFLRIGAILSAATSIAMLILMITGRASLIPVWYIPAAVMALFVAASLATVRMVNTRTAAIFVDQQVGLRERVSTALELLEAPPPETSLEKAFHAPVIASALGACQHVRTARVGYQRLDRRVYAVAVTVALAAIALTLLNPLPARANPTRKIVVPTYTQSKTLQQVLDEAKQNALPNDKATADRLKPIAAAVQQLQQPNMSAIEAAAALNEAKEAMKRDQNSLDASNKVQDALRQMDAMKDLARAGEDLTKANMSEAKGEAGASEKQGNAEQVLKNAADAAGQKMASGAMGENERKELANQLKNAANQAGADPQLQQSLNNAADAANRGDSQQFAQNMQSAGERMSQNQANQQMSQDAVNRAMSQIDQMQNSGNRSTMGNQQNGGMPGGGQNGQNGNQNQNGQAQNGQNGNNGQGQQGNQANGQGEQGSGTAGQQATNSGSTMIESPGGPGDKHHGTDIGGKLDWVRVYDPKSTATGGTQEKVGSHINPLGQSAGSMEIMGQGDDDGSRLVPFSEQLPSLRQRNMDELNRQDIPPQYQDMVKEFYKQ